MATLIPTKSDFARIVPRICIAAFSITLLVGAFDLRGERIRAGAYTSMIAAAGRDDERTVVNAGESFLATQVFRTDGRESQVRELLVAAQERPAQRDRDRAIDALMVAVGRDDAVAVMDASENFLSALSSRAHDLREGIVRAQYARAFSQWFATLAGPLDRATLARVGKYRRLMSENKDS